MHQWQTDRQASLRIPNPRSAFLRASNQPSAIRAETRRADDAQMNERLADCFAGFRSEQPYRCAVCNRDERSVGTETGIVNPFCLGARVARRFKERASHRYAARYAAVISREPSGLMLA